MNKLQIELSVALATLAGGSIFAQPAQALLNVDVRGVTGTGQTEWTFSGTTTPTAVAQSSTMAWNNVGDYMLTDLDAYLSRSTNVDPTSNNVTFTTGGYTGTINSLYVESYGSNDNFALRGTNLIFQPEQTVSWSGSFIASLGIELFGEGTFGLATSSNAGTDIELTFERVTSLPPAEPVPEPLTILGSGLAFGFGILCKRELKRKQDRSKV